MSRITDVLHRSRRGGLETTVFISRIEGSARFSAPAGTAFDELAEGTFEGATSVLTLLELVVKPLHLGKPRVVVDAALVANYPNLTPVDLARSTVRREADLRARHRLRSVDVLQIAACLQHGATAFPTNDRDLRRVAEVEVLLLGDFVDG